MEPIASGGAAVVLAVIAAVGVMSRRTRLRARGSLRVSRWMALSATLLVAGAAVAATGGAFG